MEGKSPEDVHDLVHFAFPGAYAKCVMVFAPTQIVNFTLVPLQHRLFVQQAVGLGESSCVTNKANAVAGCERREERSADGCPAHVS